jgi:signal transduction histidine kinase
VFERFVRLDEARADEAGGSGLGLSIARDVVGAHHGTISIDASPIGGARAIVVLPAAGISQPSAGEQRTNRARLTSP